MPDNKYKRLKVDGITFVFKYDQDYPDLLHIFVRHRKEPDDAVFIFFNGTHEWNDKNNRFETTFENEGLYWFWRNEEEKVIMVISCFDQ